MYGDEVVGILTCGFRNLHLYLWEAMKLLIMPPAAELRSEHIDYKAIVREVLKQRPYIQCKRHDIVKIASVMTAERDEELARSDYFYK